MPTIAVSTTVSRSVTTGAYDRVFYSSLAIAMALIVFVGFAPTYYLRAFHAAPVTVSGAATLSPLAHLHGALFSVWVLLFVTQTALIANHRIRIHQRLGVAGAVVATAMVVVGFRTAIASAARGGAPPGADPLVFLAVPLFDMVLFAMFVGTALWYRRNKEAHKRLMLLAYISIITAAVARLPGVLPYGPLVFFGLTFILLLVGVIYDLASRRRIHRAYVWGGALLVASVPVRLMIAGTDAWMRIAQFLTR